MNTIGRLGCGIGSGDERGRQGDNSNKKYPEQFNRGFGMP